MKSNTFEEALSYLASEPIIDSGYLILAGINKYEGAVISRNREGAAHIEMLSDKNWVIVQTNDDHFSGDCKERCQTANRNIKAIGTENLTADKLRSEVMLQGPNLNDITIFSAVFIPGKASIDIIAIDSEIPYVDRLFFN